MVQFQRREAWSCPALWGAIILPVGAEFGAVASWVSVPSSVPSSVPISVPIEILLLPTPVSVWHDPFVVCFRML